MAATRLAGAVVIACLSAGAAQAQYNPAAQGKTSLYADPKFQTTGQVIFYRGTGLCLSAQNGVFRDWTPILLEACDGGLVRAGQQSGDATRELPESTKALDHPPTVGLKEGLPVVATCRWR